MATVEELDQLPTEDLQARAFQLAEHRHDYGFFWDLVKHLPEAPDIAAEDGSSGGLSATIAELSEMLRELVGGHVHEMGPLEPLFRARYIDYLLGHGG